MAVPLDEQFKIDKKGIHEQRIPILNASNIEQHYFVTYIPLPTNLEDTGAIEQWIERMTFISEDLTWLLQQNHAKFWCEAAFNKDFHCMFDSYLRYAPRPQRTNISDIYSFIPNGKQLEENISRLIFLCILRLSTHKESSENFFTPKGFSQIIYDNYIFDIPRLLDICSIYALDNKELLTKIIENIFKQQPAYNKDLQHAIQSIQHVIENRIQIFHTQNSPKKIHTKSSSDAGDLDDLLDYILDLSCTINRFCSIYSQGQMIFYKEHFHLTLINLFETFLRIYERAQQSKDVQIRISNESFEETKYEVMFLFNNLLTSCCINQLLIDENKSEHFECFINILSLLLAEQRFLAAYEDYFNLSEILDTVHQTTGFLDNQQIKFYTDGIKQSIELYGSPSCQRKLTPSVKILTSTKKSLNPNVQMIRNVFPDLDEIYIETCLKHYNNNTEQLINALVDNTVPKNLQIEERNKTFVTTTTNFESEKSFPNNNLSILEQRANIYNNDEFDIFNRDDVDLSRIHRGKKTRDTMAEFDDKSHLKGTKERYARLALVESDTEGEYDDEYDDTYDDGIVNVRDKDDTIGNELLKNENRLLGKPSGHFRQKANDDDDDDDEDGENKKKSREQFVENPEVVRERWAQQRAAWQQRHPPHRSHADQQHDVVGNVRGRGQTTTVQHNRRWKDAHKSAHANHNRRNRAAQKANRGLLS